MSAVQTTAPATAPSASEEDAQGRAIADMRNWSREETARQIAAASDQTKAAILEAQTGMQAAIQSAVEAEVKKVGLASLNDELAALHARLDAITPKSPGAEPAEVPEKAE